MLISGAFQYKILVIATESMTGAINKGDAVIYQTYDEQILKVEDVIVFNKDNALIVHRIVEINNINGEIRYYTKGDANDSVDSGYITDTQIVGVIKLKIKYMGYPSLWVRSLFT
jgi:signal peptidase